MLESFLNRDTHCNISRIGASCNPGRVTGEPEVTLQ
jgi:hypothetical protein